MSELAEPTQNALALADGELVKILNSTVYPGANEQSVQLVVDYCRAQALDPMMRVVHIVPMYVRDARTGKGGFRDCILPSIDLYRIRASRSGQHVGTSEPVFGDEIDLELDGQSFRVPPWCHVTVIRRQAGVDAEFHGYERWVEAYATRGKDKRTGQPDLRPNAMWDKRRYGQLAKCAEAQALRKAFPEMCNGVTAEEMLGKAFDEDTVIEGEVVEPPPAPKRRSRSPAKREAVQAEKSAEEPAEVVEVEPVAAEPEPEPKPKSRARPKPKPEPEPEPEPAVRYITQGQVNILTKRLRDLKVEPEELAVQLGVDAVEKLPSSRINEALKWLKTESEART